MAGSGVAGTMPFENDDHCNSVLKVMKSLLDSHELLDIIICIQEKDFHCHRSILAATSPYFRAMFTVDLNERNQNRITIHGVDKESFQHIIDYAYSGKLEITRNNAQNLLAAASLFQISPILKACAKFMEAQLDASNCVGIYYFAQIHNCNDLVLKAKENIEKNFEEVSVGEEFLSLGHDKIAEIICSNELNVEKEETVFEALMRWLAYDKDSHSPHIGQLLPLIRLAFFNSKYIQESIANNSTIRTSTQCQQLLEDFKKFEAVPDTYDGNYTFNVVLRSGMIKPEHCILLVGGIDQSRPSINCYNPLTRESYYMARLQDLEVGYYDIEDPACVVTDDNIIFTAGGNYIFHENYGEGASDEDSFEEYEEETVRKDFHMYDNDHDCWVAMAQMLFPKSNFTMAYLDGKIYCFGGLTVNRHPTEIVERYDIALNRWNYVGMMPTNLVDLCSVVHNGVIYILGGRTGVGAHNVVMRYNPNKPEWTSLAGMPTPRFNFGACVLDDEIYVAGGQIYSHGTHTINRQALNSVEIYNIKKKKVPTATLR